MTKKRFASIGAYKIEDLVNNNVINDIDDIERLLNKLNDENEQLKQDNTNLMRVLENQSIIIQKLHSKILEFKLKEPIVLTKKDLELMGKAISYYTHGRYGE